MPQNWWEMYPEIVPSPASRPRPMPMLGDAMSGAAMGLQAGQPYSAFGPDPFSFGRFGPSDFTGGQPGIGQLQSRTPDQAGRFGLPEALQVSDPSGPPRDRRAAVQQAAAAIRGGADPMAVRARLNRVGMDDADFDSSDPFSDLMPGGPQVRGAMNPSATADQPLSGGGLVSRLYDVNDGAGAGAGDGGAPALDRATAIRHAADAIQRGADPDAVHARLVQMGQRDLDPPSPFSDLMPGSRPGMIGDSAPPPVPAQPALDDQGGLAPRAAAPGLAQGRLGNLPQRLDPRLAPQKAGGFQKSAQQKAGAGDPGSTTLFTYGLPSFPGRDQSRRGNPTGAPSDEPNHGIVWAVAQTHPRIPPPAPWRQGGHMPVAEVERLADLGMRMYQLHRERGMPPQEAAAWAANAVAESHGQYNQPQYRGGPAYGLFMWQGERRRMFEQQFHHPIEQSTEAEQLAFRDWELSHTLASRARRIPRGSSAGDIAAGITRYYEGPGDWPRAMLDRSNIAEAIMRRAMTMPNGANSRPAPGSAGQQRQGFSGRRSGPIRD